MWRPEWIASNRLPTRDPNFLDDFARIVVAIDPAGSSKAGADETGIVVAGVDHDGHGHILDDLSGRYQPHEWARRAVEAYRDWQADLIVAEKNFGGEMVASTIRAQSANAPVKLVNASRGKAVRAEPIASLYEQGLVHHCGTFERLEGQLEDFSIDFDRRRNGSPDRLDALVWALTELMASETKGSGGRSERLAGLYH